MMAAQLWSGKIDLSQDIETLAIYVSVGRIQEQATVVQLQLTSAERDTRMIKVNKDYCEQLQGPS